MCLTIFIVLVTDDFSETKTSVKHAGTKEFHRSLARRARKQTVTTDPTSLNEKLITHPIVDPFFARLNTFVGENIRPNRMLLNLLPPSNQKAQKGLSLNGSFWLNGDQCEKCEDLVTAPFVNIQDAILPRSTILDQLDEAQGHNGAATYVYGSIELESQF